MPRILQLQNKKVNIDYSRTRLREFYRTPSSPRILNGDEEVAS